MRRDTPPRPVPARNPGEFYTLARTSTLIFLPNSVRTFFLTRLGANLLREASASLQKLVRLVDDPRPPVTLRDSVCLNPVKLGPMAIRDRDPKRHAAHART